MTINPMADPAAHLQAIARHGARKAHEAGRVNVDDVADAVVAALLAHADLMQIAQAQHDHRRRHDPNHDQIGCWCCCWDCDFDYRTITALPEDPSDV